MDQLTAYKILGLEPGSSPEEVKEAYAILSKQFHPEEAPEKFQEIHEAYVTLTRRRRRDISTPIEEKIVEEPQKFDFSQIMVEEEPKKETPVYQFDEAEEKARREEELRNLELALEAAAEFKVLVSSKNKNNLKVFKMFFENKKYEPIIRRLEFLERMCDSLENTKLKKSIYVYICDFYHMRERNSSELSNIGLRLYNILDKNGALKQQVNPGLYGGIAGGLFAGIQALRPLIRRSEVLSIIVVSVILVVFLIWVFKKLKQNSKKLFAQVIAALGIAISQFIVIMFDLYGTLFGSVDNGNSVAAVIFLLAIGWLIGILIFMIIRAVVNLIKRK